MAELLSQSSRTCAPLKVMRLNPNRKIKLFPPHKHLNIYLGKRQTFDQCSFPLPPPQGRGEKKKKKGGGGGVGGKEREKTTMNHSAAR